VAVSHHDLLQYQRDTYVREERDVLEREDRCEDILHILPNKEQCSRRTTHSGRLMHHRTLPPSCLYPPTPYVAASTYIAAYQQQLLEGTSQVRHSNSYVHVIY
jgi:hypothetical protein